MIEALKSDRKHSFQISEEKGKILYISTPVIQEVSDLPTAIISEPLSSRYQPGEEPDYLLTPKQRSMRDETIRRDIQAMNEHKDRFMRMGRAIAQAKVIQLSESSK